MALAPAHVIPLFDDPLRGPQGLAKTEIEGVGFKAADYDEMAAAYDPAKLVHGYNDIGGEQGYFIPNPALGLWIDRSRI